MNFKAPFRPIMLAAIAAALALAISGCSPTSNARTSTLQTSTATASAVEPVKVVASVQVWANIAQTIGGKYVSAKAVVRLASQDPHSYVATVDDQLLVNRSAITIANGDGYDDYFTTLVANRTNKQPKLNRNIYQDIHTQIPKGPLYTNPHIWYEPKLAEAAAKAIWYPIQLEFRSQAIKSQLRNQLRAFQNKLQLLVNQEAALKTLVAGKKVLLTEGFAAHLLAALSVTNSTPVEFQNAVEEEQDASPSVMRQMQVELQKHRVSALIVNKQTESAQTTQLITWAKAANLPVVYLGEVLPEHTSYLTWMKNNLNRLKGALE